MNSQMRQHGTETMGWYHSHDLRAFFKAGLFRNSIDTDRIKF